MFNVLIDLPGSLQRLRYNVYSGNNFSWRSKREL